MPIKAIEFRDFPVPSEWKVETFPKGNLAVLALVDEIGNLPTVAFQLTLSPSTSQPLPTITESPRVSSSTPKLTVSGGMPKARSGIW